MTRSRIALGAVTLAVSLAFAPAAFAQGMAKDNMQKGSMAKDDMKKDTMAKDSMKKDTMGKDTMKKDEMKK